jgi:hypothetical protein
VKARLASISPRHREIRAYVFASSSTRSKFIVQCAMGGPGWTMCEPPLSSSGAPEPSRCMIFKRPAHNWRRQGGSPPAVRQAVGRAFTRAVTTRSPVASRPSTWGFVGGGRRNVLKPQGGRSSAVGRCSRGDVASRAPDDRPRHATASRVAVCSTLTRCGSAREHPPKGGSRTQVHSPINSTFDTRA